MFLFLEKYLKTPISKEATSKSKFRLNTHFKNKVKMA